MRSLAAAAALSLLSSTSPADRPVAVVELFTSEGCSSCPPADALLARLSRGGAPSLVVLGEHVDLWDHLGWRDPASSAALSRRQRAYARRLGASIYTPQVVVSGRIDAVGSREAEVRAAVARAPALEGRLTGRLLGTPPSELVIAARWQAGVHAEVLLAAVQSRASGPVSRGENAGRTLDHVAVVRSLLVLGAGVGSFDGRLALPPRAAGVDRLVLLVQEPEAGPVHAALELTYP